MLSTPCKRFIAFEGCFNFRDLGGYRTRDRRTVRWRRLFRSDALHRMTLGDAERARRELGIATVLDLRTRAEIKQDGLGPLVVDPIDYHHLPMIDSVQQYAGKQTAADLAEQYLRMLVEGGPQIAAALERLADPRTCPAVFHCAAGKDRTGILAAVVLSVLGVEHEAIVGDYILTNQYLGRIVDWMRSTPEYAQIVQELPAERFQVVPKTMLIFLDRVRSEYGSVRRYVEEIGVDRQVLRRLEAELLA